MSAHTFCWVDYSAKNPAAALQLFGGAKGVFSTWAVLNEMPGYTMLKDTEASVTGFGGIGSMAADSTHPQQWIPYIETSDISKTVADAKAAGATVQNPIEEMGPGTFAVLKDPTGAVFALWMNSKASAAPAPAAPDAAKPAAAAAADVAEDGKINGKGKGKSKSKSKAAAKRKPAAAAAAAADNEKDEKEKNPFAAVKRTTVVLHQLVTTDVTRAIGFYQRVFGWTGEMTKLGDGTAVWNWAWPKPAPGQCVAPREFPVMAQLLELPPDAGHPPMWVTVFRVANAAAAQKRMEALGCTVEVPCCEFAPFGRLVCGRDPNKGFLALLEVDHTVTGMTAPSPDAIAADAAEASNGESGVKQFAWYDLQVKDSAAAAKALTFYKAVFPTWNKSMEMPKYHMLADAAGDISGFGGIAEDRNSVAVTTGKTQWVPYVDVNDCDAFTAKAKELGATVLLEPCVMGPVRYSILRDPTNAVFALCTPLKDELEKKYAKEKDAKDGKPAAAAAAGALGDKAVNANGNGKARNPATVTWHQLVSAAPAKALAFYEGLFGWSGSETKLGDTTWQFNWKWPTAAPPRGWQPRQSEVMASCIALPKQANGASFWLLYFKTEDISATVARVTKAGGSVSLPPCDHPEGRIAVCTAPDGSMFAVMQRRNTAGAAAAKPAAAAAAAAMTDDASAADAAGAKPKKGKGKGKGKAKGKKGKATGKAGSKRKHNEADAEADDDDADADADAGSADEGAAPAKKAKSK